MLGKVSNCYTVLLGHLCVHLGRWGLASMWLCGDYHINGGVCHTRDLVIHWSRMRGLKKMDRTDNLTKIEQLNFKLI